MNKWLNKWSRVGTTIAGVALGIAGLMLPVQLGAQAAGDTVTIGLVANVNTLDPHKTATVGTDLSVISHLYSPLIIRGPDMALKPALARSWKAVDDTTWRFELVPGVKFPNGEPLDAAAVKWNVDRVLDPKVNARIKPWFTPIKEVRVTSPTSLEMVTGKPYPALAAQLSMFFLLPPKWAAENNPATAAMGTGPYDLVEFRSGDRIVLKAKSDYWGEKPTFENVVFRIMPEDSTRIAALLAGEADLVTGFPPSEIARVQASGRADAGSVGSTRFMMFKFNNLVAPFKDNPKLRLALNHAIDAKAINDAIWGGGGEVANCQVLSPAYFGYNPNLKPHPYDPNKAKQLLAEAGFPNGLDVEFEVPRGRYLQSSEIAQVVAAQLAEVGVRARIIEMEFGQWLNKYRKEGKLGQTAYLGQAWPTLDADGLLSLFEPGNQYAYYENAQFRDLVQKARAITDPERRLALYHRATEVMCQDPPHVFLFFQPITYGESKAVKWLKRGDDWVRAFDIVKR